MGTFDKWRQAVKSALEAKKAARQLVAKQAIARKALLAKKPLAKKALLAKKSLVKVSRIKPKALVFPEVPTTPIIIGAKPKKVAQKKTSSQMTKKEEENVRNILNTLKKEKRDRDMKALSNTMNFMSPALISDVVDRMMPPPPVGFKKGPTGPKSGRY